MTPSCGSHGHAARVVSEGVRANSRAAYRFATNQSPHQHRLSLLDVSFTASLAGVSALGVWESRAHSAAPRGHHRVGNKKKGMHEGTHAANEQVLHTALLRLHPNPHTAMQRVSSTCGQWRCAGHCTIRGEFTAASQRVRVRRHTLMISSYVSSSISTVVMVSSTSPRIILRCWSYACTAHRRIRVSRDYV